MMNAYLDKGVKAVYAIAIAAVLIAALRPAPLGQKQQSTAQTSPSPVQPQPRQTTSQSLPDYYSPELQAKVAEVKTWNTQAIQDWQQFCYQTAGGTGFSSQDQLICQTIKIIQENP